MAGARWRVVLAAMVAVAGSTLLTPDVDAGATILQNVLLSQVTCATPNSCAAFGTYQDSTGHSEGMFLNKVKGVWTSTEVPRPSDGSTNPLVPRAIACPTRDWCTAVGVSSDSAGDYLASWVWSGGIWSVTREAPQAAGSTTSWLNGLVIVQQSLACSAPNRCLLAAGPYGALHDPGGNWTFSFNEGQLDGANLGNLYAASCSPNACTAIGTNEKSWQSMISVLSNASGRWATADVPWAGTGGAEAPLQLSCPHANGCNAVLHDQTTGAGTIATETHGVWTTSALPLPGDSTSNTGVGFSGMACGPTLCLVPEDQAPVVVDNPGGTWRATDTSELPGLTVSNISLLATSCDAGNTCTAVGVASSNALGIGGVPVVITDEGGVLAISTAPLPADVVPDAGVENVEGYLQSVACSGALSCTGVGSYDVAGQNVRGLIEQEIDGQWQANPAPLPSNAAPA
jgi:hypothetical protein